jgi:hypothetical protein
MSILRQHFIDELELRGLSPLTRDGYVGVVYRLARRFRRSPELITNDELKGYGLHLLRKKTAQSQPGDRRGERAAVLLPPRARAGVRGGRGGLAADEEAVVATAHLQTRTGRAPVERGVPERQTPRPAGSDGCRQGGDGKALAG